MPPKKPDFVALIRRLTENEVDFVVIGGLAVVLHGVDYTTYDVDLAIATTMENKSRIVEALRPFEPIPHHLPGAKDFPWDERNVHGLVSSLITAAGDIDLFLFQPGVDSYEGLKERSVEIEFQQLRLRIACIDDLIAMKREANRPKDLILIDELEAVQAQKRDTD